MEINKNVFDLSKLASISRTINVSNDIVGVLEKHRCTVGDARELMKGYYEAFDTAIQKDPSKLTAPLDLLRLR